MKISIIGNGKLTKKHGKRIDKSDMVVRFNHARIQGFEDYRGNKTDVLGLAGATSLSYQNEAAQIDNDILRNIGWIMFSGRKRNEEYEELLLKKKSNMNGDQATIIFNYISQDCYNDINYKCNIQRDVNKMPSTGINILCYLLYCNDYNTGVHKFNIYGFDCFDTGHYAREEQRENESFHDIPVERAIIEYLSQFKNIKFYN